MCHPGKAERDIDGAGRRLLYSYGGDEEASRQAGGRNHRLRGAAPVGGRVVAPGDTGCSGKDGIVNSRIIVEFIARNSGEKWGAGPKSSQKKAL